MTPLSTLRSINPATNSLLAEVDVMTEWEIEHSLTAVHRSYAGWKQVPLDERCERVSALAALLRRYAEETSLMMCNEMGKPIVQARAEIEKCAAACAFYAREAASMLAPEDLLANSHGADPADFRSVRMEYEALGVVLAIMPWNFPYWQAIRAVVPAILAGNTVLLKPAPEVPLSAEMLQRLFDAAGLGNGIVCTLRATNEQTQQCIADKRVAAVTFTGSTRGGKEVAAQAGRFLKKTVLELGGSDAVCVCDDADISLAASITVRSRLVNSGQSCIAAKRCVVMREVADQFEQAVRREVLRAVTGDPKDETTTVGPLARRDLCDTLHEHVQQSISQGARVLVDGGPTGAGCFFAPMVVSDIKPGMPMYEEEVFGPALAIIIVDSEEEMIRVANDTRYGLGATVVSSDEQRAHRIAGALQAGVVFINDMVRSDVRFPFGGCKESGWGRELGAHGIREFTNIKIVAAA